MKINSSKIKDSYQNLISMSITYSDRLVPFSYVGISKVFELSLLWGKGGLFILGIYQDFI